MYFFEQWNIQFDVGLEICLLCLLNKSGAFARKWTARELKCEHLNFDKRHTS